MTLAVRTQSGPVPVLITVRGQKCDPEPERAAQNVLVQSGGPPSHGDLDFNAPMSSRRARGLIETLQPLVGASVVDLGCGWAELLLRLVDAEPTAECLGVDLDPVMIERARANAEARGLGDLVRFECADVTMWSGSVDVAVAVGSSHAWGDTRSTLAAVHGLLRPGGRLLLGEGIWEQPPTAAALAGLDAAPEDFTGVAGLVDLCLASGYRLLALATANLDEWDDFESRYCASRERALLAEPDAVLAHEARVRLDDHRNGWLRGYRGVLGFAYLTLAVPI